MNEVPLTHILFLSTALFFIGMYGLFTRRNLITMLMSIELMLNSVNINFVAFNKYLFPDKLDLQQRKPRWPLPLSLIYIAVINLLM
ncbi:MAG: NADH-quinone oxidoreductase subunit NuoK [Bacteroidota bacterium]